MYTLYVQQAWWDLEMPSDRPYWVLTTAALNYAADIDISGGVPVAKSNTDKASQDAEFEWAKMILAHALVAWQSPEWENGQALIDVLGPNGITPFLWNPHQTPTFMYWLKEAVEDIMDIPVSVEQTTWGAVKHLYSQEDD